MSDEARDATIAAMEPEISAAYFYLGKEMCLASIAISLKRIADALRNPSDTEPSLLLALHDIEMNTRKV